MKTYREMINEGKNDIGFILDNPVDFKYDVEVVYLDEVDSIIDKIESDAKCILDLLEPIEGLTEIEEVKSLIDKLVDNL